MQAQGFEAAEAGAQSPVDVLYIAVHTGAQFTTLKMRNFVHTQIRQHTGKEAHKHTQTSTDTHTHTQT